MRISKAADYACRAVLQLCSPENIALGQTIKQVARAQDIPEPFLRKIVQLLSRVHILKTLPGRGGRVMLMKRPGEITLRTVVEAVDGAVHPNFCLVRPGLCPRDGFCPVHPVWEVIEERLLKLLDEFTFAEIVSGVGTQAVHARRLPPSRGGWTASQLSG